MKSWTIVFGTRPEIIKLAPVIQEFKRRNIAVQLIHTGQHSDLADDVLNYFDIHPDVNLKIMKNAQSPIDIQRILLEKFPSVIEPKSTRGILIQGDTTSAFTAAQAGYLLKLPVAHLEAGLRSYDKYQPFPEELNRRLISHIADIHFAATESSRQQLIRENIPSENIILSGNTVVDALHYILKTENNNSDDVRAQYTGIESKLLLLTTHRRENFGEPQKRIFEAVRELVERNKNLHVVYPVHPNPENSRYLGILKSHLRIQLIKPLSYFKFIPLMQASDIILTDSGGIQEEAPALGKPVLVLREKTERQELIESGAGFLTGSDKQKIISKTEQTLKELKKYSHCELFGDGKSAKRVVDKLID